MILISNSYEETVELGKKLGCLLKKGNIIAFFGEVGVGKTAFISGIAKGIGYDDHISSPTFTIVNEYNTNPYIFHFDLYRVNEPEELEIIGFDEYFEREGIVLIEWAEYIDSLLPKEYLKIIISNVRDSTGDNKDNLYMRKIRFECNGSIYLDLIKKFQENLGGKYEGSGS
jgi:tRNA threonylcarbamoyladenosine biosynthesis protein TsaE